MTTYEIRVRGRFTRSLAKELEHLDLEVGEQPVVTVLTGEFEEQSVLYEMLRQIEGLGLELVELQCMGQ
jgi:hypothetical protein